MYPSTQQSNAALSLWFIFLSLVLSSLLGQSQSLINPFLVTEPVAYDSDDPAIWINKKDPSQSLIIGTDKASDGALYVYNLSGQIVDGKVVHNLRRPNNVDVAYGLLLDGKAVDIAVTTERETSRLRIFSLPDMQPVDNGGIPVFSGETISEYRMPMGIALYTKPSTGEIYAIVSRKSGPTNGTYLWQYLLKDDGSGKVTGDLVRKFGNYSGQKEIESVAADNELGYVYYSDEGVGVRKYHADPGQGNEELAQFATTGFAADHEGISIYKIDDGTGYILVSDQQANEFHIFTREGAAGNPHDHQLMKIVKVAAQQSDGSETANFPLGPNFPKGLFVAMSTDKTFHLYRWEDIAGSDLKVQLPGPAIPDAPILVTPQDGATGVGQLPTLNWNVVAGATGYHVQLSATDDFSATLMDQAVTTTSVQTIPLTPGMVYYWRVKTLAADTASAWSPVWRFTTQVATGPLVGRWNMEEGEGTTLVDISGYWNNAVLQGTPQWIEYGSGKALQLSGVDQYATVHNSASLNFTKALTLTAWIRPGQTATQYIIRKADSSDATGYELSLANSGKVHFRINEASSSNKYRLASAIAYPSDGATWMHIAATFNGTEMKLYINGLEEKSLSINDTVLIVSNTDDLTIGAQAGGLHEFKGALDEVRVYQIALSGAEIAELAGAMVLTDVPAKAVSATFSLYPNPSSSALTIGFAVARSGPYTLDIFDTRGVRVRELKRGRATAGVWNTITVPQPRLPRGLYIVRLQAGRQYNSLKLLVGSKNTP